MDQAFNIHSLGGQPCTPELTSVFAQACALPAPAMSSLWELLDRAIMDPIPDDLNERVGALCKLFDLQHENVAVPIQGIAFLLNAAAGHDLAPERFAEDLQNLCSEASPLVEILMSGYSRAIGNIREGLLRDTLFDHGNVLTGVDWRLDSMLASQRGIQFNTQLAVFTMRYRNAGLADQEKRMTLYLTPQMVSDLRRTCEYLESMMSNAGAQSDDTPPSVTP